VGNGQETVSAFVLHVARDSCFFVFSLRLTWRHDNGDSQAGVSARCLEGRFWDMW